MSQLIAVSTDPLTYDLSDCNNNCRALCSIEGAASQLADSISVITPQWIHINGHHEGSIIRIKIACHLSNEVGSCVSGSFLSNLSLNRHLLPRTARALFVSRKGTTGVLGYGCSLKVESLEEGRKLTSNMSIETFLIGGETFDQTEVTKLRGWLIPLVEVRSQVLTPSDLASPAQFYLAVNLRVPPIDDTKNQLQEQLRRAADLLNNIDWDFRCRPTSLCQVPPLAHEMEDTGMSEDSYLSAVENSIAEMKSGRLQKVVYALRKSGTAVCDVDSAAFLLAVANGNRSDEGKRYTYLFAPNGPSEKVFISLSPEQLCHVEGTRLTTEALAGTYPRGYIDNGGTAIDDKTFREHGTVSEFIIQKLSALGEVFVERKELLEMKDVVHFRQVLSVTSTSDELSGIELLTWATKSLHPTPAVCGLPTHAALESIAAHEQFNRGLYASYCGILGNSSGELLVGLRSAVVDKSTVHVFAGAGLVLGSVPADEWREIDLKMSQFVRVLTSIKRPVMSREFPNATAAVAAAVVEEMLRQGVGAFCVCPGARSTPFAVAMYRNSVARAVTQVAHDERAAGFYALGCAKVGVLCAVLVTSGTAVSNLMPSVSEARESALPMVLITSDRPSESRDVGEAQTIRQVGIFAGIVEYERDFSPPCSESPRLSANLMSSILADISFGIGEIAVRRGQRAHLNFQFRKPELDPVVVDPGFTAQFNVSLHPKVNRWLSSLQPFTRHHSSESFFSLSNNVLSRMLSWHRKEWKCWSTVMVVGEIRSIKDAMDLQWMSEVLRIPCICDTMSMMTTTSSMGNDCVFLGVDRLLNSPLFAEALSASVRVVYRIGGSMISTRVLDWMSKLPMASVVRVKDDGFEGCRHDSTWIADHYVHTSVSKFAQSMVRTLRGSTPARVDCSGNICTALEVLRIAQAAHTRNLHSLTSQQEFSEPLIAMIVQQESDGQSPVFLSSSMACRDYDGFAGMAVHSIGQGVRRVACNRGANGIDGVVSSAAGFAFACASEVYPVTVLIGDVATLHDVTGISLAAGCSPGHVGPLSVLGGGRVGKIVCVNNSGGAIFSFLPAAAHRNDFFSPYLDTPHNLNLSTIAAALSNSSHTLKCVRVTSANELRAALRDKDVFFIECFGLPTHEDNFALHKAISKQLVDAVDSELIESACKNIKWTLHTHADRKQNEDRGGAMDRGQTPLVVLLHGWMGEEGDWAPMLSQMGYGSSRAASDAHAQYPESDVLTVSSGGNVLCPSVFCSALRAVIRKDLCISRPLLLVGYSQGGRLAMHYRSMFPADVSALLALSTCPGKSLSTVFETTVLDMWCQSKLQNVLEKDAISQFLESWYGLSVFSNIRERMPEQFSALVSKREASGIPIDLSLRNMLYLIATADAVVDCMLVGDLDAKYLQLAAKSTANKSCASVRVLPRCGHVTLVEAALESIITAIASVSTPQPIHVSIPVTREITVIFEKMSLQAFEIPMRAPLVVLTKGSERVFSHRRGYGIALKVFTCKAMNSGGDVRSSAVGVGEMYEPVFSTPDRRCGVQLGAEVTYESMLVEVEAAVARLRGHTVTMAASAKGVAGVLKSLDLSSQRAGGGGMSRPVLFGLQQCVLHALSQLVGTSLVEAIGMSLGNMEHQGPRQRQRTSHVRINGFASMRNGNPSPLSSGVSSSPGVAPMHILKLKVGDAQGVCCVSDAQRVNELVAQSGRDQSGRWVRLDANQSWSVDQGVEFGDALTSEAVAAIEYIEEPLRFDQADVMARIAGYAELRRRSAAWRLLTVTLDESLVELDEDAAEKLLEGVVSDSRAKEWCAVVKPSLLSLDCRFLRVRGGADDNEGKVTISCTFESGVCLAFLVLMSSFFEGSHGVHAKADMVEADRSTHDFFTLLRPQAEAGGEGIPLCVKVSEAETLLNRYAALRII